MARSRWGSVGGAVLAFLAAAPLACSAQDSAPYRLGEHFRLVSTPQKPANPARIEVAEVFWYGCPHCFQFEPHVERWLSSKAGDVDFVRLPSSLGRPVGLMHSKAFYAAELLGVSEKIHKPLFGAIHGQGRTMAGADELQAFFASQAGVKAQDFQGAFTGFAVDSRVRRAEAMLREMGITSVPTVVVGGRYYSYGSLAGSYENLIKVVDFLVEKVRRERRTP